MGLQRDGHDWATELNWTEYKINIQKSVVFLYINNEIPERESKKKKKNPIQSSKEKAPKNESSSVSASLFI